MIYGREVWYGQGINTSPPGQSHVSFPLPPSTKADVVLQLGQPLEIVELGETEIDETTFWEYVESMREHYTPDKVRANVNKGS